MNNINLYIKKSKIWPRRQGSNRTGNVH